MPGRLSAAGAGIAPSFLPPENHQTMSMRSPLAFCRRMSRMMIRLDATSIAPPAIPTADAQVPAPARATPTPTATVISTFSTSSTKVSSQAPIFDCCMRTRASSPSQPSRTDWMCWQAKPADHDRRSRPLAISAQPTQAERRRDQGDLVGRDGRGRPARGG